MNENRTHPTAFRAATCLGALAAVVVACTEPPKSVLEPIARLTADENLRPAGAMPPRCATGNEFRPSLGCPPFFLLQSTIEKGKKSWRRVRIVSKTPTRLRDKAFVAIPTVRRRTGQDPIDLAPRVVAKARPHITLNRPFEAKELTDRSRAQLLVQVLEPTVREFQTTPVTIPAAAELTVGLAVSGLAAELGVGPTEFIIEAHFEDTQREIFRESLPPEQGGKWHDRRADLGEFRGRDVSFRFITRATAHADTPNLSPAFPLWGAPEVIAARPRDGKRNVILISLDTVRADSIGGTTRGARLTPWFDRLSDEGVVFRNAITTFSSTSASHMSLFTGTYPATHRVLHPTHLLDESIRTLPEALAKAGYATGAVTENAMILAGSGFSRGFDSYRENKDSLKQTGSVDRTFAQGIEWLEAHPGERFFLFLHTYEAHTPYAPKPEALAAVPEIDASAFTKDELPWEKTRRRYEAEIHYTDGALEHLFSELRRLDVLDDTMVVITSDHGEEFGEHGRLGHAKSVYDEVLRVPLLFWNARDTGANQIVDEQVSLIDVAPTILEFAGVPVSPRVPGRSLIGAMGGDPLLGSKVRFAESAIGDVRMVTARTAKHKWIWHSNQDDLLVFDLVADPAEKAPLDDMQLAKEGRTLIVAYLTMDRRPQDEEETAPARVLDEPTRQKLEALGYVE